MTKDDELLVRLAIIGGFLGLAKLLVSSEKITFGVLLGRVLLGCGFSMSAGVVLMHIPDLPELALIGIACALGISGQTGIEWLLKRGQNKNETQ